jgi:hypothetical protein
MKFEYDDKENQSEVIAALYKFSGGPNLCLAIKADNGKTVWFYHDEDRASVQNIALGENPVKEFRKGDKITITF